MTLGELTRHFDQLYGRRNRLFHPSLEKLSLFLVASWRGIQGGIRNKQSEEVRRHLANLVGWVLAIDNQFGDNFANLPFAALMTTKYSRSGCANCRSLVCCCPPENRPPPRLWQPNSEQASWNLQEWQKHLFQCYGDKNREKGLNYVLCRLVAEIGELCSFVVTMSLSNRPVVELERELGLELTDVVAWTCALTSLLELDLEEVVLARYGTHCPECRKVPCTCGSLELERANLPHLPRSPSFLPR